MRDPSAADEPPSKRRRIVAGQLALPGAPTVDDGLVVVGRPMAARWRMAAAATPVAGFGGGCPRPPSVVPAPAWMSDSRPGSGSCQLHEVPLRLPSVITRGGDDEDGLPSEVREEQDEEDDYEDDDWL